MSIFRRHQHDWLPLNRAIYELYGGGYVTKVTVQCQVGGCGKTKVHEHPGRLSKAEHIQALYPKRPIKMRTSECKGES